MDHLIWMEWGFANLVRPTIVGTPRLGQRLTVEPGRWWPKPTSYRYQWYRDGVRIAGATTKSRMVVAADLGARLKATVVAQAPDYRSASRVTTPVGPIRRP